MNQTLKQIGVSKSLIARLLNFTNYIFPEEIESNYLALFAYKSGLNELANKRVKKDQANALFLNIQYSIINANKKSLECFFVNYKNDIEKNLFKIKPNFIISYVNFIRMQSSDLKIHVDGENYKANREVIKFLDVFINLKSDSAYKSSHDKKKEFIAFSKVYRRLEISMDSLCHFDIRNPLVKSLTCKTSRNDILNEIIVDPNISRKDKATLLLEYTRITDNDVFLDIFKENKNHLHCYSNHKLFLESMKSAGDIDGYIHNFRKHPVIDPNEWVYYFFVNKEYGKLIKFSKVFYDFRLGGFLDSSFYLLFLAYISLEKKSPDWILEKRKAQGLNIKSYGILTKLYNGDVIGAEIERENYRASLQNYININYHDSQVSGISRDKESRKVLFTAEQGVADEVRWSRLYHKISQVTSSQISISCDPRFHKLFSDSFANITFLPWKRKFRMSGQSLIDFHEFNIPDCRLEFDEIYSTSKMFEIVGNDKVKTKMGGFLKAATLKRVTSGGAFKIGIMWSSSLSAGLRGLRYGIDFEDYLPLIQFLHKNGAEVYSIQSPMSEEEIHKCNLNGVKIVCDKVDLYNDFYSSSSFYSELNVVVGVSSLNTELAAAVGTKFYHIANSPEVTLMRNGDFRHSAKDQLGNNTVTVYPENGYGLGKSNTECVEHLLKMLDVELKIHRDAMELDEIDN
ncbi:hypothetical protein A1OQ_03690 [Enterovibrio norvegicus FF-162]|uniref:hypothetical protein n=1 Tax=Enterovibrio norvegicus TaxID=188144 RepID=UPI0002DD613F|nr:hypothetical protein [Enterovibrio norvegicus]OEE83860.1 hypothetical protein A1OQ_03690 [Enterovibrio norvegicus FF-162]